MRSLLAIILSIAVCLALTTVAQGEDLDRGFEIDVPPGGPGPGDDDCYLFGGTTDAYTGADRGRGNTYTVFEPQTLTEFKNELVITGNVTLYFYVLESAVLSGTYTVLSETIVPTTGVGQAFYSSGPVSVPVVPGMYYGIGCAWGPTEVTYLRDPASLPRNWDLGTVEDCMQISAPPPYGSISYNHFPGGEYSMDLCFLEATPVDDSTWGDIKAVYR